MATSEDTPTSPRGETPTTPAMERPDQRGGLRWFLVLDMCARLFIWCTAWTLTAAAMTALGGWPSSGIAEPSFRQALEWSRTLAHFVLLFNTIYVAVLIVLRLPIPTPKEGRYSTLRRFPDRQVFWSCLIAILTKARYQAPFPAFLVFHFANLPPLCWLMGPLFGPRSRSCYVLDPHVIDPHMVTLGRNVVIGFNATIAGHYQDRDSVVFKRTVIEDDVVVGGHVAIAGGVHIQRGAMIGANSLVLPNSVIGPNEYWAGVPARRRRDLTPGGQVEAP